VLVKEIPEAIRVKLTTDRINAPHSEIAKEAFSLAKEQDDASHRWVQLISEFQSLSSALESERYNFKSLCDFRKKHEVKESLERVKNLILQIESEKKQQQKSIL
jgi:hypothetical protein